MTKILFEDSEEKRAVGVEFASAKRDGSSENENERYLRWRARCTKEVVLS